MNMNSIKNYAIKKVVAPAMIVALSLGACQPQDDLDNHQNYPLNQMAYTSNCANDSIVNAINLFRNNSGKEILLVDKTIDTAVNERVDELITSGLASREKHSEWLKV